MTCHASMPIFLKISVYTLTLTNNGQIHENITVARKLMKEKEAIALQLLQQGRSFESATE